MAERYIVVGEETTFGSPVTPDKYIDIRREAVVFDVGVIPVETVYSRDTRKYVFGKALARGPIDFAVEPENVAHLFKWALGSVTTSGAGPYTHDFTPADTVKSFTAIINPEQETYGFFRKLSGCLVERLTLESALDVLTGSVEIVAAKEEKDTAFTPSVSLSPLAPFVFHEATLTLGGADKSSVLKAFRLTVGNNLPVDDMYAHGDKHLRRILVGRREVEVQMELAFEDSADYDRLLAGTEVAASLSFVKTAGSAELLIDLPRMVYHSDVAPHIAGRDPFTVVAPCQVLYDSAAGYEVKIQVKNNVAGY
ncbi:phage tail tube protein [Candidatus Hecatella orcuttiae]|jgi:hypothetical protein|uniref:phage tail tube protein n=1 Tax=Candidatus Hecatella orcuttiae TaxID=1935119 RepID=UPI002867C258|nr:phage tail tube protein [Candidatus Hecatella orcuttiae]